MKYVLSFLILFCLGCKEKEANFIRAQIKLSKLDSLATEKEVENFVQNLEYPFVRYRDFDDSIKISKALAKFQLQKISEFRRGHDSLIRSIADSLKVTESFYKTDLDNNGFTDLLVIGDDSSCYGGNSGSCDYSVYALMNFGSDSINPIDLIREHSTDIVPKIEDINGRKALMIFEPPEFSWPEKEQISDIKKIELVYKNGTFVEYNDNPKKYSIERIEYKTEPCYGRCPIFDISISSNRTAYLNAVEYNSSDPNLFEYEITREIKGKFESTLDKESYQEIIDLLNYLDFPTLEDHYRVMATDLPGSTLTITYDRGKKKVITDYGQFGTLGLKKIYNMIANLRTSQNWK